MTRSTLALCIPAYNAANFLPTLLTSAQEQFIPFDEIIVYNDCSTDNTTEIAERFGAKVVQGDINRGCSYGKNKLAEVTFCEWIHFHDADDDLLPNFTQLAHKWMVMQKSPDIVVFNFNYVDSASKEILAVGKQNRMDLIKDAVRYCIKNKIVNFGLYKKKKFLDIGGFDTDPSVLYNEDVAFHTRMAIHGALFDYEDEISCINYRFPNSMSSANALKCIQAHYHVMRKVAEKVGDKYRKEIASNLWRSAGNAAAYNDLKTAYDCVKLAIELNGNLPHAESNLFKFLCFINPYFAVRLRENLIRTFKPHLR